VAITRTGTPGAGPGGTGPGIAVRELVDDDRFPLSAGERSLLATVAGAPEVPPVWVTRCRAAKEAVARALAVPPDTVPCVVTAATDRELTVEVAGRAYQVRHRELTNPDDLPPRRYVVAWTWGQEPDRHPAIGSDSQSATSGGGR
jgi:hypothetical protein